MVRQPKSTNSFNCRIIGCSSFSNFQCQHFNSAGPIFPARSLEAHSGHTLLFYKIILYILNWIQNSNLREILVLNVRSANVDIVDNYHIITISCLSTMLIILILIRLMSFSDFMLKGFGEYMNYISVLVLYLEDCYLRLFPKAHLRIKIVFKITKSFFVKCTISKLPSNSFY